MIVLKTFTEFAQAIDHGEDIELNVGFNNWGKFSYNAYVIKNILKYIEKGCVRIKPIKNNERISHYH